MANVFKENRDVNEHPNRNNFDKSFQNNLTMKMGTLYPFLCLDAVPGDSFRISLDYGLKFMPMPFPVQSRMKAYFYYFWVPNRIMWPESKSFLQGLKDNSGNEIVHPYIDQDSKFFKTGSLADYLGVPSTVVTTGSGHMYYDAFVLPVSPNGRSGSGDGRKTIVRTEDPWSDSSEISLNPAGQEPVSAIAQDFYDVNGDPDGNAVGTINLPDYSGGRTGSGSRTQTQQIAMQDIAVLLNIRDSKIYPSVDRPSDSSALFGSIFRLTQIPAPFETGQTYVDWYFKIFEDDLQPDNQLVYGFNIYVRSWSGQNDLNLTESFSLVAQNVMMVRDNRGRYVRLDAPAVSAVRRVLMSSNAELLFVPYDPGNVNFLLYKPAALVPYNIDVPSVISDVVDADELPRDAYRNMRISALPFRAYEMCYNSFFRNTQNQPFRVNGHVQYNKYVTTEASGADSTPYHLEDRNWELDFLTSCLPSPQQGVAPLVGLTESTFEVEIVDDGGVATNAQLKFNTDGAAHTANVSIHNPGESIENDRTLSQVAMAAAGMSINDFRNVNALQHWLETNLRKGFRYIDFIEGHFGKAPSQVELDMPQFIGGFNEIVNVNTITQTSSGDENNPLGSFAGQANLFGSSRSIEHYCDDYGYILGLICIVPTPSYSQLLPKHFLKHDKLDYYFHEFAQLGMQPVPYGEVCPLQTVWEVGDDAEEQAKKLHEVFGYQRPNYDMCASVDEVHGQFRIDQTMRNMLINRVFAERPELGDAFLKINPADTQNIFAYQAPDSDNIVGQLAVNISAKRPLPRIHMPSLGR